MAQPTETVDVFVVEVKVKLPEAEAHKVAKAIRDLLSITTVHRDDYSVGTYYYGTFNSPESKS